VNAEGIPQGMRPAGPRILSGAFCGEDSHPHSTGMRKGFRGGCGPERIPGQAAWALNAEGIPQGVRPGKDSGPSGVMGAECGKDSGPSEPLVPDSYLGPFCRRFLSSFIRECGKDSAEGAARKGFRAERVFRFLWLFNLG
jgi:hypothetical protein